MPITYKPLTQSAYVTQRYDLIRLFENYKPFLYDDSKNKATIGTGFNVEDDRVRIEVVKVITVAAGTNADGDILSASLNNIISTHASSSANTLAGLLNPEMKNYSDAHPTLNMRTTFTFTSEAEAKQVFNTLAPTYENVVSAKLPSVPQYAEERLALFSLAYNSPTLIGPKLTAAISDGNRAEAWYEIRYDSNGDDLPGIAKGRYYESEVFKPYKDHVNPTLDEAKEMGTMFAHHKTDILAYDKLYGAQLTLEYNALFSNDLKYHIEPAITLLKTTYNIPVSIALDELQVADTENLHLKGDGTPNDVNKNDFLIGDDSANLLNGGGGRNVLVGGAGNDALGDYNAATTMATASQLYGGAGDDHFGVFGKAVIKDIERNDKVYVDNIQVTGGIKPLGFDVPIATNFQTGHVFQVAGGDILQENGATLNVKFLWDNDAIATIENYTRPYLQQGDGHIEIYQVGHGSSTPLATWIKAYNDAYNNTTNSTNTTTTAGGGSAAAPSGASNSANSSANVYKPTIGTTELHATIDAVFDGFSGSSASAALAKWQQHLPTLLGLKDYVLHTIPQTEDFFGNAISTPINIVGMSDTQLLTDIVEEAYGRTLPLTWRSSPQASPPTPMRVKHCSP